jgi:hypothetical protein
MFQVRLPNAFRRFRPGEHRDPLDLVPDIFSSTFRLKLQDVAAPDLPLCRRLAILTGSFITTSAVIIAAQQ